MATSPIQGIGVAPTGQLYNELEAATRRAFVRRLFVQMYFASPTLFYLWGNSQRAAGGLNQVTVPMQGQSMVQGGYTGYGGGFNAPVVSPGIQNGQFNLSYWTVPIPLPFGETVLQATDREVNILKARLNDAYAVTRQNVAQNLFTLNNTSGLLPNSFIDAFDNGTNAPTYGGINRLAAGNQNYKGQLINAGTGSIWDTNFTTSTLGWNRQSMAWLLNYVTDAAGGEAPTFVSMSPPDFGVLNTSFIGTETMFVRPGGDYSMNTTARSSFPNLNVSGVPIFQDHFCPVGTMVISNSKYTTMYLSEDAMMDFSGFRSLIPLNQIGQTGVVVLGYNLISAKSVSGAIVTGFGSPYA